MFDTKMIVPGLIGFVGVAALPFWLALAGDGTTTRPSLELPKGGQACVEPGKYMRNSHMLLLSAWKEAAVRRGNRVYVARDGRRHEISLTATCLGCHDNGAAFCDRCHDYTGVTPTCWSCHVRP